jgi:hypothetical protein
MKHLSDDEIVVDMISEIEANLVSKETWLKLSYENLIEGHHTTGRAIRNYYLMWDEKNPYFNENDPETHPDERSMRVMRKIWKHFHNHIIN